MVVPRVKGWCRCSGSGVSDGGRGGGGGGMGGRALEQLLEAGQSLSGVEVAPGTEGANCYG